MRLSPLDIEHMEFPRSAGGYHRGHVRDFLQRVAADVEELLRDMQALHAKLEDSERRVEELQTAEAELQRAVIAAERIGNELRENAKREAQLVLQEAERVRDRRLADIEGSIHRAHIDLDRLERDRNLFREQFRGLLEAYQRSLDATAPLPASMSRSRAPAPPDDADGAAPGEVASDDPEYAHSAARRPAEKRSADGDQDPSVNLLDDATPT